MLADRVARIGSRGLVVCALLVAGCNGPDETEDVVGKTSESLTHAQVGAAKQAGLLPAGGTTIELLDAIAPAGVTVTVSGANGINSSGTIVGGSYSPDITYPVWTGPVPLSTPFMKDATGQHYVQGPWADGSTTFTGISDDGTVVGYGGPAANEVDPLKMNIPFVRHPNGTYEILPGASFGTSFSQVVSESGGKPLAVGQYGWPYTAGMPGTMDHWPFTADGSDTADLSPSPMPTQASDFHQEPGEPSAYLRMNGNRCLQVPAGSEQHAGGSPEQPGVTLMAWIRLRPETCGVPDRIVLMDDLEAMMAVGCNGDGTAGVLSYFYDPAGPATTPLAGHIPFETWTHIAVTFDQHTIRTYINGDLAGSVAHNGALNPYWGLPLSVGCLYNADSAYDFVGDMHDVALIRNPLSHDQVVQFKNGHANYHFGTNGSWARYRTNDDGRPELSLLPMPYDAGTSYWDGAAWGAAPDGTIVGYTYDVATGNWVMTGMLYSPVDGTHNLNKLLPPDQINAWHLDYGIGVNSSHVVVGVGTHNGIGAAYRFDVDNGVISEIPQIEGNWQYYPNPAVTSINAAGHIAGYAMINYPGTAGHALVYTQETGSTDLNDLLDPAIAQQGWVLRTAHIYDGDVILGQADNTITGVTKAYKMTLGNLPDSQCASGGEGAGCDDHDLCTLNDVCHNGTCAGTPKCTAQDQCHGVGVCTPSTGVCSNPPAREGLTCDDGNPGTQSELCHEGTCKAPTQFPVIRNLSVDALATLPGQRPSIAMMNTRGQIAGGLYDTGPNSQAAFWTSPSTVNNVSATFPSPSTPSFASAINDFGTLAGQVTEADGAHTFIYDGSAGFEEFASISDGSVAVSGTSYQGTYANHLNESGQIAGVYTISGGLHGYRYTDGLGFQDIGSLNPGHQTIANRVGEEGTVVGSSWVPDAPATNDVRRLGHAVKYDDVLGLVDLNLLVDPMAGWTLYDAPDVVGDVALVTGDHLGVLRPARLHLSSGALEEISGGYGDTTGAAIDEEGDVVGSFMKDSTSRSAFIFTDRIGFKNLNDLIDPSSGWHLETAIDVNINGDVIGFGYHNGVYSPYHLRVPLGGLDAGSPTPIVSGVIADPTTGGYVALVGYTVPPGWEDGVPASQVDSTLMVDGVAQPNLLPPNYSPGHQILVRIPFKTGLTWSIGGNSASADGSMAGTGTNYPEGTRVEAPDGTSRLVAPNFVYATPTSDKIVPRPADSDVEMTVGKTFGTFGVTEDGSANYRVPLWVPPGRGGLQPDLALVYSSRRGVGPYGMGWAMEGLSQITRCEQTWDNDLTSGRVRYDATDALCLDGDRLLYAGTTDNGHPFYFKRENDFSKVIRFGDLVSGTTFRVALRDGRILVYGGTDATITGQPSSVTGTVDITWSLKEVDDRYGNKIVYSYDNLSNGEQVLSRIDYVYDGSTATRSVAFYNFARQRPESAWVDGMHRVSSQRVEYIEMTGPDPDPQAGNVLRSYRLKYDTSPVTGRDRLISLQECDGQAQPLISISGVRRGTCKRPTTFQYGIDQPALHHYAYPGTLSHDNQGFRTAPQVGDLNGDGYDDVVYQRVHFNDNGGFSSTDFNFVFDIRLSDGQNLGPELEFQEPALPSGANIDQGHEDSYHNPADAMGYGFRLADTNGDGRADIITKGINGAGTVVYRSTFTNMTPTFQVSATDIQFGGSGTYAADLDGNGLPDSLVPGPNGWTYHQAEQAPYIGGPTGDVSLSDPLLNGGTTTLPVKLFRRAGIDFLVQNGNSFTGLTWDRAAFQVFDTHIPALSTGAASSIGPIGNVFSNMYVLADVNGDGLTDVIDVPTADNHCFASNPECRSNAFAISYYENHGGAFGDRASTGISLTHNSAGEGVWATDVDGDGRDDLIVSYEAGRDHFYPTDHWNGWVSIYHSNGHGFDSPYTLYSDDGQPVVSSWNQHYASVPEFFSSQYDDQHYPASPIDVNGDGRKDIIVGPDVYVWTPAKSDVMTAIVDGLGHDVTISYRSLGDRSSPTIDNSTFYTPSHACQYPQICVNSGLWAVSEVDVDGGNIPRLQDPSQCTDCGEVGGGRNRFTYSYDTGRFSVAGDGWLGFRERTLHDMQRDMHRYTIYDNSTLESGHYWRRFKWTTDLMLVGLPAHDLSVFSDATANATFTHELVKTASYSLGHFSANDGIIALMQTGSTVYEGDTLNSLDYKSQKSTTTRTFDSDTGDELTSHTDFDDGASYDRVVTYDDDLDQWLLNRTQDVTETSTPVNGDAPVTRKTHLTFYDGVPSLHTETFQLDDFDARTYLQRTYDYSTAGQVHTISETNLAGETHAVTTIDYDTEMMFPTVRRDAMGHVSTEVHHPGTGALVFQSDSNGAAHVLKSDRFGRARGSFEDSGLSCDTNYALAEDQYLAYTATTSCVDGSFKGATVDRLERTVDEFSRRMDGRIAYVGTGYDDQGRVVTKGAAQFGGEQFFATRTYTYDPLDRVIHEYAGVGGGDDVHPGRSFDKYFFYRGAETNSFDPLVTVADIGSLRPRHFTSRDLRGQMTTARDYKTAGEDYVQKVYGYGAFGVERTLHTISSASVDGGTITYFYDVRGRLTGSSDPNVGQTVITLDAWGNKKDVVDGAKRETQYFYDAENRLTSEISPEGESNTTWDTAPNGIGRVASSTAAEGLGGTKISYAYDLTGHPTSEEWKIGDRTFTIGRTYSLGKINTVTFPATLGEAPVSLKYNYSTTSGEPESVTSADQATTYWQALSRDASGRLTSEDLRGGLTRTTSFDLLLGAPNSIKVATDTAVALQDLHVDYDDRGNVKSRKENATDVGTAINETYTYDALLRLRRWESTTGGYYSEYTYDDIGNRRTAQLHHDGTVDPLREFRYGENGAGPTQLTSGPDGTYSYDDSGDQKMAPGRTVEYTHFNLPRTITHDGHVTVFDYTADGHRAVKRAPGLTQTTVGGVFELNEGLANGRSDITYLTIEGNVVGQFVSTGGAPTYQALAKDQVNSTVGVFQDGGVLQRMRYEPFGQRIATSDSATPVSFNGDATTRGYTGDTADDLGLIDMNGRIYDSNTARFVSSDPKVGQGRFSQTSNGYAYALNNPVRFLDPSGFDPLDVNMSSADAADAFACELADASALMSGGEAPQDLVSRDSGGAFVLEGAAGYYTPAAGGSVAVSDYSSGSGAGTSSAYVDAQQTGPVSTAPDPEYATPSYQAPDPVCGPQPDQAPAEKPDYDRIVQPIDILYNLGSVVYDVKDFLNAPVGGIATTLVGNAYPLAQASGNLSLQAKAFGIPLGLEEAANNAGNAANLTGVITELNQGNYPLSQIVGIMVTGASEGIGGGLGTAIGTTGGIGGAFIQNPKTADVINPGMYDSMWMTPNGIMVARW